MAVGKCFALKNAAENFLHSISETIGFGHALDFRLAKTRAQNRRELAEAVDALVVHLDHDDALEFREDFLEPVRQRMNVAQMNRADFFANAAGALRRIVDRPVG